MKKIIGTEKELLRYLKHLECKGRGQHLIEFVRTRLRSDISVFDEWYGEKRNLKNDLGGYMVILYGNPKEMEIEYKKILKYHNLKIDDYEYEDNKRLDDNTNVSIQLFLCSSDYAVEIVIIKEGESEDE